MSKEAMKLALEALEKLVRFESDSWELGSCRVAGQAIKALREALAEQPAQQDIPDLIAGALGVSRGTAYDMMREDLKDASPVQEQVAAELERIAQEPPVNGNNLAQARVLMAAQRIRNTTPTAQPTQQGPVGEVMLERMGIGGAQVVRFQMYKEIPPVGTKLYTSPPAQSKPLTDEEIAKAIGTNTRWPYLSEMRQITRAIEAAHGIKEKNT